MRPRPLTVQTITCSRARARPRDRLELVVARMTASSFNRAAAATLRRIAVEQ